MRKYTKIERKYYQYLFFKKQQPTDFRTHMSAQPAGYYHYLKSKRNLKDDYNIANVTNICTSVI